MSSMSRAWVAAYLLVAASLSVRSQLPDRSPFLISQVTSSKLVRLAGQDVKSKGHFWPASTIKVLPAISAVFWLRKNNLKASDKIDFHDSLGRFNGPIERLVFQSLIQSSNKSHDRLVRLVSIRLVRKTALLVGAYDTWIFQPYAKGSLRYTPNVRAGKRIVQKSFFDASRSIHCRKNCTSLLDLQRIMCAAIAIPMLRKALSVVDCPLRKAARKLWPKVKHKVFCKPGWVPNNQFVENGVVSLRGRLFAVTIAMESDMHKSYKSIKREVQNKLETKMKGIVR